MIARLCPGCAPHKGPLATGLRVQDCLRLTAPGGAPLELDVALGKVRLQRFTFRTESDRRAGILASLQS
jgi:hypothetical protein